MPINVEIADRNRVIGMIRSYLRGEASTNQVVASVNNSSSSFRGQELYAILHEAEQQAFTVDVQTREALMGTLKVELRKEGFLD
jgi:hypothetical protein